MSVEENDSLLEKAYQAEIDGVKELYAKSKEGFLAQLKETPYSRAILQYPNSKIRDIMAEKFKQHEIVVTIYEDETKNRTIEGAFGFWASLPEK